MYECNGTTHSIGWLDALGGSIRAAGTGATGSPEVVTLTGVLVVVLLLGLFWLAS